MNDSILKNLFKYLNIAVLKRLSDDSFQLIGTMPVWLKNLYPDSFDKNKTINLGENSPFLENFLTDAETFWESETSGKLWSGQWIEESPAGKEYFMEATALFKDKTKILLIELSRYSYEEKQSIIQKGRELGLDYRRLDKLMSTLKESEARFRDLFKNSPDAIFVEDLMGNVLDVNPAACRLHGIERKNLIGMNVMDLIPPSERKRVSSNFSVKVKGEWKHKESFSLTADGRSVPIEISGTQIEYLGKPALLLQVRDITKRKEMEDELRKHRDRLEELVDERTDRLNTVNLKLREEINERKVAEEALRASKDKYSNLFQSSNDIIFIHDLDDNILEVNQKAVDIFGYTREEFLSLKLPQLRGPETDEQAVYANEKIEKHGFVVFETDFLKKNGEVINAEASSSLLEIGREKVVQAIIRDITKRKQLEEQLRQAQKMEAIGRLAGGVAHDFNNSLTVITGYSELLMLGIAKNDPMFQSIKEIKKAAARAESLTRQLLAFSRKQIIQPNVLNINNLIENMKKMLGRLIGEDIELITSLDPETGHIKADPGQIEQVIMNLIINASDAIPQGGKITIELQNINFKKSFTWEGLEIKAGFHIMLTISDTGIGMDKETQNHIFEPFFTTKKVGEGTGLGLSTVYGIVRQNDGYMTVQSELGMGSVIQIYFPCVKEVADKKEKIARSQDFLRGNETILVAEDEDVVRELACQVLRIYGYNVLEAPHGGSAILKCEQYKDDIHLILSDIVMPEMSGPELVTRLKLYYPEIKVLYMSGYTDDAIVRYGILEDNIQFIQKPFSPVSLLKKIRTVLETKG